jgi:hypothetical protein
LGPLWTTAYCDDIEPGGAMDTLGKLASSILGPVAISMSCQSVALALSSSRLPTAARAPLLRSRRPGEHHRSILLAPFGEPFQNAMESPLGQAGCGTVAVSWAGTSAGPCLCPVYFTCKWALFREPTSGLEPLTCSLRVITQALQGCAGGCKSRISRRLSLLRVAACCTVLRSRWYQSGINFPLLPA